MIALHFQQFYIDPVSGYVFRSKKDVLRYLESGDVRSCAFKPSRRQIQDEDNITVRYFCMTTILSLLLLWSILIIHYFLLQAVNK